MNQTIATLNDSDESSNTYIQYDSDESKPKLQLSSIPKRN